MSTSSIYLIYGTDEMAVKEEARGIVTSVLGDATDESLEIIEADGTNADGVLTAIQQTMQAVQQTGLFGGDKVVWMRDAVFWAGGAPMKAKAAKEAAAGFVETLAKGIPDGHRLVITAPGLDGRLGFNKTLKKLAKCSEHNKPEANWRGEKSAREEILPSILKKVGLQADAGVIDLIISRAGLEPRQLTAEVEKLDLYLGKERRQVSSDDVMTMVAAIRESAAWDLPDAMAGGNLSEAMRLLQRLIDQREAPVRIAGAITRRFRELMLVREAMDRKWLVPRGRQVEWALPDDAPEGMATISRWHPFRVGIAVEQARKLPIRLLLKFRELSVDTHEGLMSSSVPPPIQLELLVLRLHALRQPKGRR